MSEVRVSAKQLGSLALPDFCARCFWIDSKFPELSKALFPGIFSSIDKYTKLIVKWWFDQHGSPPDWLSGFGKIKEYRDGPHYSSFQVYDKQTSVLLTGNPDGLLVLADDSYVIVDYKTARKTETQDELFPMYEVQLNAYAYIGERCGISPVSALSLIYMEPVTEGRTAITSRHVTPKGFLMGFSATAVSVPLNTRQIPKLLREVHKLSVMKYPPKAQAGCERCASLIELMKTLRTRSLS